MHRDGVGWEKEEERQRDAEERNERQGAREGRENKVVVAISEVEKKRKWMIGEIKRGRKKGIRSGRVLLVYNFRYGLPQRSFNPSAWRRVYLKESGVFPPYIVVEEERSRERRRREGTSGRTYQTYRGNIPSRRERSMGVAR